MKNWVHRGVCRKFQFVGHRVDLGDDGVWSVVAEGELVVGALGHRCLDKRLELQENLVANLESAFRALLVLLLLHAQACPLKMLPQQFLNSGTFVEPSL